MQTRHDFLGLEFDWFAVDADGFLALFSSAGWGPVPDSVFELFEGQQAIERHLCQLSGIEPVAQFPQGVEALADQGIYVYDWENTHGPYRRQAVPVRPVRLEECAIPEPLRRAWVVLRGVRFASAPELTEADMPPFTDVSRTRRP